jgi:phosphoribosylglycinamide formyltransferase-1
MTDYDLPRAPVLVSSSPMAETATMRLGILGSGAGSNCASISKACSAGEILAEVAVVLSDTEEAGILQVAQEGGMPNYFIAPGSYRTKLDESAEATFIAALEEARVDLVVLAGFMRVLKGDFMRAFEGRVVNVHPSLLPSFPGLEAWRQALEHGVKVTGATVHFVDQGVDSGPIIAQETVRVLDNDTPESLRTRIQEVEHSLYPATIGAIARDEVALAGRRTLRREV